MRPYRELSRLVSGLTVCLAFVANTAMADDIQMLFDVTSAGVVPNVLIVVHANSEDNSTAPERLADLAQVRQAVRQLLAQLGHVNAGLLYTNSAGTLRLQSLLDLDSTVSGSETPRNSLSRQLDDLSAESAVSAEQLLYAAQGYYAGVFPVTNDQSTNVDSSVHSPIQDVCQRDNHVVLVSNSPRSFTALNRSSESVWQSEYCAGLPATDCAAALITAMNSDDVSSLAGPHHVNTHTIGLKAPQPWLRALGSLKNGVYAEARDAAAMKSLAEYLSPQALRSSVYLTTPGTSISHIDADSHDDSVFIALFEPGAIGAWPGNLKKYKITSSGSLEPVLRDALGTAALDSITGEFRPGARSFWSGESDGNQVRIGGANEQVPNYAAGNRKLYTWLHDISRPSPVLSSYQNAVEERNIDLEARHLGVASDARKDQIQWLRGRDVDDGNGNGSVVDQRHIIGAPMHSRPVSIRYGSPEASDTSAGTLIFMATNWGALHAFDADTGEEYFAFIPMELLALQQRKVELGSDPQYSYGLDGAATVWRHDRDGDGLRASDQGDFARLYLGMRRGGRNYYALDVINPLHPRVMWEIKGGITAGFEGLGQTWGQAIAGRIQLLGDAPLNVLFLSGGYDPAKDEHTRQEEDTVGQAIYIVNALTGERVWSGGAAAGVLQKFPKMKYSIPATLAVADSDEDGFDDIIVVGDTGGQVWRFDIRKNESVNEFISGGVIADLGVADGPNTQRDDRRFYHGADIARLSSAAQDEFAITLGSGNRSSPLGAVTLDRLFMLRQSIGKSRTYTTLYQDDLLSAGVSGGWPEAASSAHDGWYLDLLHPGEKVLSVPLSWHNTVTFSTYQPSLQKSDCATDPAQSRFYQVRLPDAAPVNRWSTLQGELKAEDRSTVLKMPGNVSESMLLCGGGKCRIFVGAERVEAAGVIEQLPQRTFWREELTTHK